MKHKVTLEEAKSAVQVLLDWLGEDSQRPGLENTSNYIIKNLHQYLGGYEHSLTNIITYGTTIDAEEQESSNKLDFILLKDIKATTFCEHRALPVICKIHIAYIPKTKMVSLGRIQAIVDMYSKRLQIQERMTKQIALAIDKLTHALGVAVIVEGTHYCATSQTSIFHTQYTTGHFKQEQYIKQIRASL